MRVLPFVLAGGLAATAIGCGLDANGLLGSGDDGGDSVLDAEMSAPDGTLIFDASGPDDATISTKGDTGPTTGDGSGGADTGNHDGAGPDTGGSDTGVPDTGAHDAGMHDTGVDTGGPDACDSVEICNNGIDDDCNGLVDCADPACTAGWTCTAAPVPSGWSVVSYAQSSRPACPAGYGTPADVVEGPIGAPATCGCTCNVTTAGSCESGQFSVSGNLGPTCGIGAVNSQGNGGACSPAVENYSPTGARSCK